MPRTPYKFVVVGGGIIGLSTAMHLLREMPWASVVVLEKERAIARHQTGHNSGVIHAGVYYEPGSAKARFALDGSRRLKAFCRVHGVPMKECGKLLVATERRELARLDALYERGVANGLQLVRLDSAGVRDHEPACAGIAGVLVRATAVTDFELVAARYADVVRELGGEIRTGSTLLKIYPRADAVVLVTSQGDLEAAFWINCAGLHGDRVARLAGVDAGARIVPFRGEYYELTPGRRALVRGLIYPVPDPTFPFLGVHLTRGVDGLVHCGPNAVLALAREGYSWSHVDAADILDALRFRGLLRLVGRHWRAGLDEVRRSWSTAEFARSLARLVPGIVADDLVPASAGVRAQAVLRDGRLVDDFLIADGDRSIHVLNAPSPAATASLPIGEAIVARIPWRARERVARR